MCVCVCGRGGDENEAKHLEYVTSHSPYVVEQWLDTSKCLVNVYNLASFPGREQDYHKCKTSWLSSQQFMVASCSETAAFIQPGTPITVTYVYMYVATLLAQSSSLEE